MKDVKWNYIIIFLAVVLFVIGILLAIWMSTGDTWDKTNTTIAFMGAVISASIIFLGALHIHRNQKEHNKEIQNAQFKHNKTMQEDLKDHDINLQDILHEKQKEYRSKYIEKIEQYILKDNRDMVQTCVVLTYYQKHEKDVKENKPSNVSLEDCRASFYESRHNILRSERSLPMKKTIMNMFLEEGITKKEDMADIFSSVLYKYIINPRERALPYLQTLDEAKRNARQYESLSPSEQMKKSLFD